MARIPNIVGDTLSTTKIGLARQYNNFTKNKYLFHGYMPNNPKSFTDTCVLNALSYLDSKTRSIDIKRTKNAFNLSIGINNPRLVGKEINVAVFEEDEIPRELHNLIDRYIKPDQVTNLYNYGFYFQFSLLSFDKRVIDYHGLVVNPKKFPILRQAEKVMTGMWVDFIHSLS